LLKTFWESFNLTRGMREGNDFGTQYRSDVSAHLILPEGSNRRHSRNCPRMDVIRPGFCELVVKAILTIDGQ
jgi:hypothetical protein